MLLYGAGGHAKTIIACAYSCGIEIRGIFDDGPLKHNMYGIPFLGKYDPKVFPDEQIVISIGTNYVRKITAETIFHRFGNIQHASALIDKDVRVAQGTVCMHRSIVQADTTVGRHVIINTGTIVEHDCFVGDFVHLAPGVVLCGNVRIGEDTFVGAGTIIIPNLEIGKDCIIAAGSVITKNIPTGATVRGNPGRIIRINS